MDTVQNRKVLEYADEYARKIWEGLMANSKDKPDFKIRFEDVSDMIVKAIVDACEWYDNQPDIILDKLINICIDAKMNCENSQHKEEKKPNEAEELAKLLTAMNGQHREQYGIVKGVMDDGYVNDDLWRSEDTIVRPRSRRGGLMGYGTGMYIM